MDLIKSVSLQAGRCEPRLMEGDLVVLINGRDISEHTHDQVVMFIRASRESHSRELALLIRRRGAALSLCQPDVLFVTDIIVFQGLAVLPPSCSCLLP